VKRFPDPQRGRTTGHKPMWRFAMGGTGWTPKGTTSSRKTLISEKRVRCLKKKRSLFKKET